MIEIDPEVLPEVIPFRRPTGVVIREPSTIVSITAPAIVSIPPPPSFTQSTGISSSTFMPQVSTSVPLVTSSIPVQDFQISELTDMLYACLLSMVSALYEEFISFRSEARTNFSEIKEGISLLTQALTVLSNRFDRHEQSCRTEAVREDQTQEEVADREMNVDNVQDCSVEDLVKNLIESVDLSALSNVYNIYEQNIENNLQIVVYVDPDTSTRSNNLDDSDAANDMGTFFANFIEINSDDDDDIRYEKLCKVKEEDSDDIIILSDIEENVFYIDAKDKEVANTLYGDLPSEDEIPEATPDTSSLVVDQAPTTTAPSSTFEVGQPSIAQADIPPSDPVIPPSILEKGPAMTRQRRQINIHVILGIEKDSADYQYEYLMFIKCQHHGKHLVSSPHLIVWVISVSIKKFVNIWYPVFEVERRDCVLYTFSEADFNDLSIDDVEFLYDHFRNLYHRTEDVSQALFNPYGVVYRNASSQKFFLRFEEINHYSDGTLKVIKLQLENRLKAAVKSFLESRSELYQIENEEIQLLKRVLTTIDERLIFRSTLRRLEVMLGLNRLRQREERH
ncbi:hypothetical protein L6452_01981 [Arctium lappa]|uniref:Uncharacterized protein n=1 Tax=Arctium lappa TaxID=4217 RepID=A0ACB9FJ21_ARCLA|nr:hypothetical protein L6452_01981 [Arctium lappa]